MARAGLVARPLVLVVAVPVVLVVALVLGACTTGSDGQADGLDRRSTTAPTSATEPSARTETDGPAPTDPTPDPDPTRDPDPESAKTRTPRPTTIEEWEALWASQRAAIIEELSRPEYGVDPSGILRGPGGLAVDLSQCPEDWSDTAGIVDGTIDMVDLTSNNLHSFLGLRASSQAYVDRLGERGGIGPEGLTLRFREVDVSAFDRVGDEQLADLVGSGQPFAVSTGMALVALDAYGALNGACIPQPLLASGHPALGDPENHPWTTGLLLSYHSEARIWVEWIEQNFDRPVTVAGLVMDNEFGLAYEQGFRRAAEQSDAVISFEVVRHEPAAGRIDEEMERIVALEPDVFISMTAGNPCLLAVQATERSGLTDTAEVMFTPSVCTQPPAYLLPAGAAANGWRAVISGWPILPRPNSPEALADPWLRHSSSELRAAGLDPELGIYQMGYGLVGWTLHQLLEIASRLPGGLSRSNLLLAQRGITGLTHPLLPPGVDLSTRGAEDGFLIEGGRIVQWDADGQRWVDESVIDVDGQTLNCVWQPVAGCP